MKQFYGYNNEEEARKYWGDILDNGQRTERIINIVDDPTKWPQTSSTQKVSTRIELDNAIIAY